jgi:outer membrane protein OmpU
MKKALFATTAASALLMGGIASAQGVALFGDARLGLGYNIYNDGSIRFDRDSNGDVNTPDDLRAISRVRFGVNMTGETDSGITFGATIRADNAAGGEGGKIGQTAGSVFVSGSFGTLTLGDTNAADEQWVGDVPGDFSLTGLGDLDETRYVSNGGSFGNDSNFRFASNPEARPTIRYDFDIMGFGISVSSNRDLTDVGVGAGYSADFGGGSWSLGAGYYDFADFTTAPSDPTLSCVTPNATNPAVCDVVGVTADAGNFIPDGHQWSVGLSGDYDAFAFGVTYISLDTGTDTDNGLQYDGDNLLLGASFTWDAWSVGAVYGKVLNSSGSSNGLDAINNSDSYELSAQYDLGGGAALMGGVRRTYNLVNGDGSEANAIYIGDFGISMAF